MIISILSRNLQIVEALVKAGIDVDTGNKSNGTPIFFAVLHGCEHLVEYLIENHADLMIKDNDDNTLLHIASKLGYNKVIEILLKQNSIDLDSINKQELKAADVAINDKTKQLLIPQLE